MPEFEEAFGLLIQSRQTDTRSLDLVSQELPAEISVSSPLKHAVNLLRLFLFKKWFYIFKPPSSVQSR